jgi:hypothetical protein
MTSHRALLVPVLVLFSCGHQPPPDVPVPAAASLLHLAQVLTHGDLVGLAIDSTSGAPLWGAQVTVQDSLSLESIRAVTDTLGVFVLRGLPNGEEVVAIRYIGFCPKRFTLIVPPPPGFAFIAPLPRARCESPPGSDVISCTCP